MKHLCIFCLSAVLLLVSVAFAQSSPEEQVRKAMEDNASAQIHRDKAALERQYADDYYRIGPTGRVWGKAEYLKMVMGPGGGDSRKMDRSDVKIRIIGDVAIATGLSQTQGKENGEVKQNPANRFIEVWVKHDGTWQKTVASYTSTTPVPSSAYHK